jgi:hypothetical protein
MERIVKFEFIMVMFAYDIFINQDKVKLLRTMVLDTAIFSNRIPTNYTDINRK